MLLKISKSVIIAIAIVVGMVIFFSPMGTDSIHLSKRERVLNEIREILKSGVEPNVQDKFGNTLLMIASMWGDFDIVQDILESPTLT